MLGLSNSAPQACLCVGELGTSARCEWSVVSLPYRYQRHGNVQMGGFGLHSPLVHCEGTFAPQFGSLGLQLTAEWMSSES